MKYAHALNVTAIVVVLSALGSTGCASKLNVGANLSAGANCTPPSIPTGIFTQGSANASNSTNANGNATATANGGLSGRGWGTWNGRAGGQASGNANGHVGTWGQWNGHAGGQAAGQCGCKTGGQGRTGSPTPGNGTAGQTPGIHVPPEFYGVPLRGAQDVVFVLDRSGSMSESTRGVLGAVPAASPLAIMAALGIKASSSTNHAGVMLTHSVNASSNPATWNPLALLSRVPMQVSWQESKLDAAKAELIGTMMALPDGTRFNLVFFNEGVSSLSAQLVTMNPTTRFNTITFINGMAPAGTTAAVPALRQAYQSGPKRVVLLSDGLANTGGDGNALLAEARMHMKTGTRFDTVGVGYDQDAALMTTLASESGGMTVMR